MIYDIFTAYNCPTDRIIYLFYDIIPKVIVFILLNCKKVNMNKNI